MEELAEIAALLSAQGQFCPNLTSSSVNVNKGKVLAGLWCRIKLMA